jgi:hypothetical protein
MSRSDNVPNPFESVDEDSESIENDLKKVKTSNNLGVATRVNMPYIPPVYRPIQTHRTQGNTNIRESTEDLVSSVGRFSPLYSSTQAEAQTSVQPKAEQHICYVCRRKFRDKDHLSRHERISFLHSRNSQSKLS